MAVRAGAQSSKAHSVALLLGGCLFSSFLAGWAWKEHETKLKMRSIQEEADRYKLEADRYIARKKQETERYKLEAERKMRRIQGETERYKLEAERKIRSIQEETEHYKLEAQTERGLFDAARKQRAGRVAPAPTQQQS